MLRWIILASMTLVPAACAVQKDLFLIPQDTPAEAVKLRVSSIELRDIILPAYGAEPDILLQGADGALRPLNGALWADEPRTGMTQALARRLDLGTTATVTAEPWPLLDSPDVTVQVIVDRMVARADGQFDFSGQFGVTSRSGVPRDFLRRFDIQLPYFAPDPQSLAEALGHALSDLATEISASLR